MFLRISIALGATAFLTAAMPMKRMGPAATAAATIPPAAIAAHMRFLGDDLLEGRETGTRGFDVAARYVAAQFTAAGLKPAGDDGTWFQNIVFRTSRNVVERSSLIVQDGETPATFTPRTDYVMRASFTDKTSDTSGEVVFAGFGIVAPELGRDDYADIDARGKIVLMITGAPSGFPNTQRAHYSSTQVKDRIAADHGAIGVIALKSLTDEKRRPFARSAHEAEIASMRRLDASGRPADSNLQLRFSAAIASEAAQRLFLHAPQTVASTLDAAERGTTRSFPLGIRLTAHVESELGEARSENVVAMLPGADAARRNEYVAVTAHLDHLGTHPGASGDAIYNGVLDNASGIACLIEIARAFTTLGRQPARSILFAAFTGEEKGEEGSAYLAERPPVSGQIIANVNMDMFLMLYPMTDLVMFGGEHSTLGPLARPIIEQAGFQLSPDPSPEEVRFVRSDQYSFVKQGIPAITLKAGSKSSDPSLDGARISREWLRTIYHSPKDDLSQSLDFASGARYARTNFLIALAIANARERPRWNQGDFFGERYGRRGPVH